MRSQGKFQKGVDEPSLQTCPPAVLTWNTNTCSLEEIHKLCEYKDHIFDYPEPANSASKQVLN